MFAGPIIAREVLTIPRPLRFYLIRSAYASMLFILMWTAWQSLIGWQDVREIGLMARFGHRLYQVFALVELTLMLFFAPIAAASAIAHEKDRRTFNLLLMTDLRDVEIVIGKLSASLLMVATLLATSAPVFYICLLLGGVSFRQLGEVLTVTLSAGLIGGSLGLLIALWRDRTFQSLALTILAVVLGLVAIEGVGQLMPNLTLFGNPVATTLNPYRNLLTILEPPTAATKWTGVAFIGYAVAISLVLNAISIVMLRKWNPSSGEPREQREEAELPVEGDLLVEVSDPKAGGVSGPEVSLGLHVPRRSHRRVTGPEGRYRAPWDWPVIWRELKTRAYGSKPLIVKGAYALAFALGVAWFYSDANLAADPYRVAKLLIPLSILTLLLVNAQAVTSLTSERDTGALDLLLVTELSPKEFIFGKLYGAMYNTKEMVLLPLLLMIWFAITRVVSVETTVYVVLGYGLMVHFASMLGLHAALSFTNSRAAVANSLGTIFFLMVGILVCAFLIILSDREFGRQLLSFLFFIGAGSLALFLSLGARNPSPAIALVSALTPFFTFYCVINLLNGDDPLGIFVVGFALYGFALLSMLIPAVFDFDISLGRTSAIQG